MIWCCVTPVKSKYTKQLQACFPKFSSDGIDIQTYPTSLYVPCIVTMSDIQSVSRFSNVSVTSI